jgi:hypothetical protein
MTVSTITAHSAVGGREDFKAAELLQGEKDLLLHSYGHQRYPICATYRYELAINARVGDT